METVELNSVLDRFVDFLKRGTLGPEVINALMLPNGKFIPKEGRYWDYKRDIPEETPSLAKTVLQIVSFYNAYGGYLIYGVEEVVKDTEFSIALLNPGDFQPAQ